MKNMLNLKGTAPKTTPKSVQGNQGTSVTGTVLKNHHKMRPTTTKKFPQ